MRRLVTIALLAIGCVKPAPVEAPMVVTISVHDETPYITCGMLCDWKWECQRGCIIDIPSEEEEDLNH